MKKHAFDPLSFIAGTILLMIAGASVLNADLDLRLSDWVLPASVLVLGIGLLVASLRGMGAEDTSQQIPEDGPEADDGSRTAEVGTEPVEDPSR